ncbi:MAG: GldG family protein [Chloroflexi bacterium]|nr:GldG family protein [Chloroflexota bacterium]
MVDRDPSAISRPLPEDARSDFGFVGRLKDNLSSIRVLLFLVGTGAALIGAIVWLFIRDLASAGILVLGIGVVLLLIDAAISWRDVGTAVFGRRGRYGANTVILVVAFIAISAILNWLVFWLADRPDPMGWLRVDTTATKQFVLSDQAVAILNSVDEPIRANAFFVTDTPAGAAAWQETQDLLNEFRRRSSKGFEFRLIDPELEPNLAAEFGVTVNPSIAVEAMDSRRVETIQGLDPRSGPQVFNENDISTSLLIVSQIQQKGVLFITGHGEADITDSADGTGGFGRALQAVVRDNYAVASATMQELGRILGSDGESGILPAVVIFAGPETDLDTGTAIDEVAILLEYMRRGGSVLFMLEPDTTATWREVIGRYGLTLGTSQMVDTSSFVAPNANFLQIKKSNGQITASHQITDPIDVLYMPGVAFVGRTVDENSVPVMDDGTPYLTQTLLAQTTLASWEESGDEINFDVGADIPGPLPVAVAVEAIAELSRAPGVDANGDLIRTNIVLIGDFDFGSNSFFSSAKNGDLFANSVNWLAKDFELISTRPKTRVFRELVLTQTERDFIRWTGWLLMPVLLGAFGVASWWRRR